MGWDPAIVPDPQDPATFERSKLDWSELSRPDAGRLLALYHELGGLRHRLADVTDPRFGQVAVGFDEADGWLRLTRGATEIAVNLSTSARSVPVTGTEVLLSFANNSDAEPRLEADRILLPPHSVAVLA
jgi:maltooligosyltrehalose trehalohydrolase